MNKPTKKSVSSPARQIEREAEVLKELPESEVSHVKSILDSLPDEQRRVMVKAILHRESMTAFNGPIPPPDYLKGYEEVLQGSSERILKMAELQQQHRIEMERTIVKGEIRSTGHGQWLGAGLAFMFGLITFFLGYTGHDLLAGTIGTTTIIGLGVIFVLHKRPDKASDDRKQP